MICPYDDGLVAHEYLFNPPEGLVCRVNEK
jgi:hypothetical protein